MLASAQPYDTANKVLAFPEDDNKYVLTYGELIVSLTPRMWQQKIVMRLMQSDDQCRDVEHGRSSKLYDIHAEPHRVGARVVHSSLSHDTTVTRSAGTPFTRVVDLSCS